VQATPDQSSPPSTPAWATSFTSVGTAGETVDTGDVRVVRAARLSLNATPEPVKKGRTLTVRGKLERASWARLRYSGYSNRQVDLLFRAPGGSYQRVKTVTTASDGSLRTTVKAAQDGAVAAVAAPFAFRRGPCRRHPR